MELRAWYVPSVPRHPPLFSHVANRRPSDRRLLRRRDYGALPGSGVAHHESRHRCAFRETECPHSLRMMMLTFPSRCRSPLSSKQRGTSRSRSRRRWCKCILRGGIGMGLWTLKFRCLLAVRCCPIPVSRHPIVARQVVCVCLREYGCDTGIS